MDGAGDPPPRGERRRALRRARRAHRRARPAGQRARLPPPGRGARRGRRGRRGARARRAPRPAARRAVHRQGGDRGRRDARAQRLAPVRRPRLRRRRRAVRRLRDAGAILLGKTNVPEFCAHWDTYNELFGATANPHDPTRSAGGSSGGEAAALASAMTRARPRLGPTAARSAPVVTSAALFGLRPGRDTVPWADHHPMVNGPGPRMMATVGPMARCVDDLELALAVLAPLEPAVGAPDRRGGLRGGRAAAGERGLPRGGPAGGRGAGRGRPRRRRGAPARAGRGARAPSTSRSCTEAAAGMLPGRRRARGRALAADPRDRGRRCAASSPRSAPYLEAFAQLVRLEREADAWLERHGAALCPVAPDVAPPLRGSFGPVDGEPVRPGGKLTLCTVRQRARAAGGGGAGDAHGRGAARRRPAHRRAAATSARCWRWRASSSARSAAGWIPTRA